MTTQPHKAHMPSDVTPDVGPFDRFATRTSGFTAKPWFFTGCVALIVIWAPSYFVLQNTDTWQLVINTVTTIVTFLLVALFQNTVTRQDEAVQDKLNAIAEALANIMTKIEPDMQHDIEELRDSVGLEERESV